MMLTFLPVDAGHLRPLDLLAARVPPRRSPDRHLGHARCVGTLRDLVHRARTRSGLDRHRRRADGLRARADRLAEDRTGCPPPGVHQHARRGRSVSASYDANFDAGRRRPSRHPRQSGQGRPGYRCRAEGARCRHAPGRGVRAGRLRQARARCSSRAPEGPARRSQPTAVAPPTCRSQPVDGRPWSTPR